MPKSAKISGIKSVYGYTIQEAAELTGVSERTVREWIKQGLPAMSNERPTLMRGDALIAFIKAKRSARKTKINQDESYCLKCRSARKPADGFVEYETNGTRAKLTAICEVFETVLHKPVPQAQLQSLSAVFDLAIQNKPKIGKCTKAG